MATNQEEEWRFMLRICETQHERLMATIVRALLALARVATESAATKNGACDTRVMDALFGSPLTPTTCQWTMDTGKGSTLPEKRQKIRFGRYICQLDPKKIFLMEEISPKIHNLRRKRRPLIII